MENWKRYLIIGGSIGLLLGGCNAKMLRNTSYENKIPRPPRMNTDSVIIEYFIPSEVSSYVFIANNENIIVKNEYTNEIIRVINDQDSVRSINKIIDNLFVNGQKKAELGRIYKGFSNSEELPILRVKIYYNGKLEVEHLIYFNKGNYEVVFSRYFINFHKLIDELRK